MARGSGNGGMGGSGVFGLIGTTVQCKAEDDSPYCTFAKIMNLIFWLIILGFLAKLGYEYMRKRK